LFLSTDEVMYCFLTLPKKRCNSEKGLDMVQLLELPIYMLGQQLEPKSISMKITLVKIYCPI